MNFRNNLLFYSKMLLAPYLTPNWRTTPCSLSAAAYSIYSQLPSIGGGSPSLPNPGPRHAVLTRDPPIGFRQTVS
jgi:hypothetical protein